jgi:hypothetical protein
MNFLFRETYWAGILILAGLLLILRNVFKVDIPVLGVIIPIIIISWGINMLLGSKTNSDNDNAFVFSKGATEVREGGQHSVVFGKGDFDVRGVKPNGKNIRVDVDAVFSSAAVMIDPNTPTRIKVSSVFASGRLPDGSVVSFGERKYFTPSYKENEPYLDLRCDVVFGDLKIYQDATTSVKDSTPAKDTVIF